MAFAILNSIAMRYPVRQSEWVRARARKGVKS